MLTRTDEEHSRSRFQSRAEAVNTLEGAEWHSAMAVGVASDGQTRDLRILSCTDMQVAGRPTCSLPGHSHAALQLCKGLCRPQWHLQLAAEAWHRCKAHAPLNLTASQNLAV